jgi:benzoyl-CoA reductase/2-hydroxyglutaryl-CoA dehydratase subunit BcrC/BadD/HgdB
MEERMSEQLQELLDACLEMHDLSIKTEEMRDAVDRLIATNEDSAALKMMIDIDTNMLHLMDYHIRLSTALLRNSKD